MAELNQENTAQSSSKIALTSEQLQALMASQQQVDFADDEIDLAELWAGLVKRKGLIVFLTGLVTLIMLVVSFQITPKYESSVKLMPVSGGDAASGLMAKYGGLASLAGISLPSGGDVPLAAEAVEVLQSKRFLADFIVEKNLKPILFYKNWDQEKQQWLNKPSMLANLKESLGMNSSIASVYEGQEVLAEGEPSVYAAVELFNKEVLSATEDGKSGLYALKIKWDNPVLARDWANELVQRIDNELRQNALHEAQATIDYMNKKLETIALQDIRNIALQTIEENMKKITFAQVQKQYVFKVIDPAIVADKPVSPKKGLMVAVGFVLGLMLSVFLALVLNWRETSRANKTA